MKRRKWEYLPFSWLPHLAAEELNEAGLAGWELVTFDYVPSRGRVEGIMKRRIK